MSQRSVIFYTHALTGGGAERVWALLASGFAARGWKVTLALDFAASENASYLDARVRTRILGRNNFLSVLRLASLIRTQKPDITISAISGANLKHALAAILAGRPSRAILTLHGYSDTETSTLSRLGFFLHRWLSAATARTVCVSDGLGEHLTTIWKIPERKLTRIYNPVVVDGAEPPEAPQKGAPLILSAGRLISYKNFGLLLRAFSKVDVPGARLCILGEGEERASLQAEIQRLGLAGRVEMPGYAPQPWEWYRKATCFALPSDREPFGLVVVEALAFGLPVVATACDGPAEILDKTSGHIGRVTPVGDEAAFAAALTDTLRDPGDPKLRIARAADFSLEKALDAYAKIFEDVLTAHQKSALPARQLSSVGNVGAKAEIRRLPKLLFYTHALAGGGAERVWAQLASGFSRDGHEVLFVVDHLQATENRAYLDPGVRLVCLGGGHAVSVLRFAKLLRKERPDVILSALSVSNLKAALAAAIAGFLRKLIISYHGFAASEARGLSGFSYRLTPVLTRVTGGAVAVSESLRDDLIAHWRADPHRLRRIYNPIARGRELNTREFMERPPRVVAVGRLDPRKKFDDVLRAFAKIPLPNATIDILGDGPDRSRLERLIEELGLSGRANLRLYQENPWSFYENSKCLVTASSLEAFSLVVAEALAHGLEVVSTDSRGPREILADGKFGTLVPVGDIDGLAKAMTSALTRTSDPGPRLKRATEFSVERALQNYGALIDQIVASTHSTLQAAPDPRRKTESSSGSNTRDSASRT